MVQVDVAQNAVVRDHAVDLVVLDVHVAVDALDAMEHAKADALLYAQTSDAGLDLRGFLVVLREDGMVLPG